MTYKDMYNAEKAKYSKKLQVLNEGKEQYNIDKILETTAYRVMDALHLEEKISVFKESDGKLVPNVSSASAFKEQVDELKAFMAEKETLLNDASLLHLYFNNINKINQFVKSDCHFLPHDVFIISIPATLKKAVDKFVHDTVNFEQALMKEYLDTLYQTAIKNLSDVELKVLIDEELLSAQQVKNYYNQLMTAENKPKFDALFQHLGVAIPATEVMQTKLKGVTHDNEDGSSRQEYLKELQDAHAKKPQSITVEQYIYDDGKEKSPAARVMWGNKCIGCLAATLMEDLTSGYNGEFQLSAEIVKVNGGADYNYGCLIDLSIHGVKKAPIKLGEFMDKQLEKARAEGLSTDVESAKEPQTTPVEKQEVPAVQPKEEKIEEYDSEEEEMPF